MSEDCPLSIGASEVIVRYIRVRPGGSYSRDWYDTEVLRQVKEGLGTFGNKGLIDKPEDVTIYH